MRGGARPGESQPLSDKRAKIVGVSHTLRGGIGPGELGCRYSIVGYAVIRKDFIPKDGELSSPGVADSNFESQQISDRPLGLEFPHRPKAVLTRGSSDFVTGLLRVVMYERFSDPGMESYRLRLALAF